MTSLCFIGCHKSEPTDLRLLDLKGDVETVTTYVTPYVISNITSGGVKARKSQRHKRTFFNINTDGLITSGNDMGEELTITRDKRGRIVTIICECSESNYEGYTSSYSWDKDDYPIEIVKQYCYENYPTISIIYDNDRNVIAHIEKNWYMDETTEEEPEQKEYQIAHSYYVIETDEHENWTKRIEMIGKDGRDLSFNLEERIIKYYSNDNGSQSGSSNSNSQSKYTNDSYSNSSTSNASSSRYNSEEIIFRSASDVINYLNQVAFTDGEITLQFRYDGLYANGRLISGAIVVDDYNEVEARISCNSPYNGSHMRFHLVSDMLVKHLNTGEIYYIIK